MALLGLAVACGPVAPTGAGDDTGTGADDAEGGDADDRPGTGPSPTTTPTMPTSLDDEAGESDVDDGWKPDFGAPSGCSDANIADCYDAFTHDGYTDDVERITVGDVNVDGWLDLVGIGDDRDQIGPSAWIFVHPGQVEPWGERIETWTSLPYLNAIVVADVVGDDGLPDLVGTLGPAGKSLGGLAVAPGDGDGHFAQWSYTDVPGIPELLRAADVDGDGTIEVIATLHAGTIAIVRSFEPAPDIQLVDVPLQQIDALEVGALGVWGEGGEIVVSGFNPEQPLFAAATYDAAVRGLWTVSSFQADAVAVAVRDYDVDGTSDVATASWSSSQALLYGGVGDGTLEVAASVDLGGWTLHATGGQFGPTMQGLVALVDGVVTIADFESGTITALEGPTITGPFMAEDINQDGLTDIVAPVEDRFNVVVYLSHL
jgi:hypothetical protein